MTNVVYDLWARDRLRFGVIAAVVLLGAMRLFYAARAELLPEEAYYWTYLQHPALSYYDHPPMVAWVIALGTALLGDTELGVRLGTIILSLGSCWLIFLTGRIWFGRQAALWAAFLFAILPIFVGTGTLAFPDGPLIFFWLLTLYLVSKAIHARGVAPRPFAGANAGRTRRTLYWLLAGLAFGLALLSKYTAVMLGPSLALFLLFSREHRVWLRRAQPWIALIIALLVFAPVIIWNAQHDWASFRFQTLRSSQPNPDTLTDVLNFWGMQVGALTPMLFALFIVAAWHAIKSGWWQRDDRWNFVASFFVPLFLVFVKASFTTDVHINWTAPAYLSLTLAGAAVFAEGLDDTRPGRVRWWRAGGLFTAAVCGAVFLLPMGSLVWVVPKALVYHDAGGWRELGRTIEAAEENLEKRTGRKVFTIGTDKYPLAAELGFYTREPDEQVNTFALGKQGLGYRYWTDLRQLEGLPAVAVLNNLHIGSLAELSHGFDHMDEPRRIEVATGPSRSRTFYVVNCYGYRATPSSAP
ncbi:MAG: glycosyltransferase family 39 protein [Verrucomicrobiia bacterium]